MRVSASLPLPPCPQPLAVPASFWRERRRGLEEGVDITLDSSVSCCKITINFMTQTYLLPVLEVRSPETRCEQEGKLLQGSGNSLLCLFHFQGPFTSLDSWTYHLQSQHTASPHLSSADPPASLYADPMIKASR